MPHTEADLDRMLADHEARYGKRNDELLIGTNGESVQERAARGEPDAVRRMEVHSELEADKPYGDEPRKNWPTNTRAWTPELVAERRYWVSKFVKDQGLTYRAAGNLIGVHNTTVQADAHALGIRRGSNNYGKGGVRELQVEERKRQIRFLFEEQRLDVEDIAGELGVHTTTVYNYLKEMGLGRGVSKVANRQTLAVVSRAITAMDDMAQLLLNLPELETLQVDEEQAKTWTRQLRRIARANGRVRNTTKGTLK